MILMGGTVYLRGFVRSDTVTVTELLSEGSAAATTTPYWYPLSERAIEHHVGMGDYVPDHFPFAVAAANDDRLLGIASVTKVDLRNGVAEVGYAIWRAADRGRGYGRDALWVTCNWAFEALRLRRLYVKMFSDNEPSRRCAASVGFVEEGTWRRHAYHRGRERDLLLMGLLRAEFMDPLGSEVVST